MDIAAEWYSFALLIRIKHIAGVVGAPKDKYDEYIKHWILIDNPDYKEDKEWTRIQDNI